ncbi:MAG: hypothetical protein IIX34_06865 [Alistipes sp.]|nr:hypothetical protein [Alistipes sp.]
MKKITLIISRLMVVLAAVAFIACEGEKSEIDNTDPNPEEKPDPKPEPEPDPELTFKFAAEFVEAGSSSATVKITTENIAQYAYSVETSDTTLTPELIFAKGEPTPCVDGEEIVEIKSLSPNTDYVVLFAGATVQDEYYEQVVKVTFKTASFTEELTIYDIDYMSFSAHFNFPKDKVLEGNVIKWGLVEFPVYYTNRNMKLFSDAEMLNMNDDVYHNYVTESTTWLFNEENSYIGTPSEEAPVYYDPIVPGQPMYFMLGEFAYSPEDHWGWGSGYYNALFNFNNFSADYYATGKLPESEKYWYGYNKKVFVQAKQPEKISAKPEVTFNLTPLGGNVTIDMPDSAYGMCVGMMDTGTMLELLPLLNNDRSLIQWYITSYHSFMSGISFTVFNDTTVRLEDYYYMRQGVNYTLYITTLGDEYGAKQSYKTFDFTLPKPTKPAPTASVQATVNPETKKDEHDFVWFNLKCTSSNAIAAKYLANYEREWAAMVSQTMKGLNVSEQEAIDYMLQTYGADLTAEELAAINQADGWNINFSTRPDATTVCGLSVMNDEGTWASAIDMKRSAKEPNATPVSSTLFEDLKGEWTATTTIRYTHWHYCSNPNDPNHDCGHKAGNNGNYIVGESDGNNYTVQATEQISSKVIIGEVGYEKTLPEEVYNYFFEASNLKTKEQVDAVYNQFKGAVDDFNANVRGQNRILCQGFSLEYDADIINCQIPEHTGAPDGKIPAKYASPYELFIADAETYSAYNYESPVFDFGPKWYLEVGADGKVTAPFNTGYFSPMAQWYEHVFQFIAACSRATMAVGSFPVEISADKNTITINPFKHTFKLKDDNGVETSYTEDFYPQIARDAGNGQYQLYSMIVAPIVLTRNGAAAPAAQTSEVAPMSTNLKSVDNVSSRQAPKSRTALPLVEDVKAPEVVKYRLQSAEELRDSFKRVAEKRYSRN